jgi:hypothetical protein
MERRVPDGVRRAEDSGGAFGDGGVWRVGSGSTLLVGFTTQGRLASGS